MTAPVDPVRRPEPVRKSGRAAAKARRVEADPDVGRSEAPGAAPPPEPDMADPAVFAAHLMGQERRRGLRAGHDTLDRAKSAYTRTEWSGSADRRAPTGGLARTKI